MALTKVSRGLLSTGIVDNSNATAITLNADESATFAGAISVTGTATAGSAFTTGAIASTAVDGTVVDRSGNTSRFVAGRSGGNYAGLEMHVAGASGVTKRFSIDYDSTTKLFAPNGTSEHLVVTSAGNLLVGGTTYEGSTTSNASSAYIASSGFISANVTNDFGMQVNRTGTNGTLFNFRKNGVDVGNISVISDDRMVFATADGLGLQFDKDNNRIIPCDATGGANSNVSLGSSGLEFKNLYLSGGALTSTVKFLANTTVSGSDCTIFRPADNTMAFSTNGAERIRLTAAGEFCVGGVINGGLTDNGFYVGGASGINTYSVNSSTGSSTYHVYDNGGGAYKFYVNYTGTIAAANQTISGISDIRWKENIRDLDDGLSKVMQLQPRKFDWKEGKGKDVRNDRGFIAQEFETVFPDLIDEWIDPAPEGEEPYKAVRADLIPTLVKAIQEQQATIETLTQRIETLEQS